MVKETEHYHKWFNIMERVKQLQAPVYTDPQPANDGNLNYSASLVSFHSNNPPATSSSNPFQSVMASNGPSGFLNAEHRDEKLEPKTVKPYTCKVLLKGMDLVVKAAVDGNNNVVQFICTGLHLGGSLSVTKQVGKEKRENNVKVSILIDQIALYNTLQPINYTRSQDVKKSNPRCIELKNSVLSVFSVPESRHSIRRGRFQVEARHDAQSSLLLRT